MTRSLRRFLSAVLLAGAAIVPGRASAVTQSYCTFPSPLTTWTLNQNAFEALNSEIRLTDAVANEVGSAFLTTPIPITATTNFHAYFRFQIGPNAGGGDGLAFVLQNSAAGAAALGGLGGGMGYSGVTPSVIVEFDTYKNTGDPNGNHVGLMLDGSATHTASATPAFTMAGGGVLNAWVDYTAASKTISVYLAQTATKPATAMLTYTNLVLSTEITGGQMYVGFTAATGAASPELNQHDVYELELSTDGVPCSCEGDGACSGATPACAASGLCAVCSATNHTACTGATPVCDVPVNQCVACLTNADCSGAKPICDKGTLTCRACSSNADCGGATPECATSGPNAGTCVACIADANCPPSAPRCDMTKNSCAQCLSGADCGGDTPVCSAGKCKACASDADCGGTTPACEVWGACGQCSSTNAKQCKGGTAVCDFPTGSCVACEFNSDCSGGTPTCNTATHTCRPCMTNADCVGNPGGPACVTSGMKAGSCVVCQQDSDCTSVAAPKCDTVANLCVACLSNADCSGATPVCSSAKICVGCLTNADCSGSTPICDTASSTCRACQNDYAMQNPGPLACPTAAAPACQPTGTPLAGQCATCSALNGSVCATTAATPVCIPSSATCGCAKDSDCNADSYCDTTMVSTGTCKAGCRVMNGTDNCATGEYCTKTDGTLGTCMSEPCNQNSDCKAPTPVCNTIAQPHACVQCLNDPDCPSGQVCDAMNHCVACTTKQTQNCTNSPSGPVCLANETCGCTTDSDCGNQLSGKVCDGSKSTCASGCRGTGGNGCPAGQVCSSTDGTVGTCQNASTSVAASTSSSSSGTGGAGGGTATGGGSGSGGGHVVSASVGCGCRVDASGEDDGRVALLGALIGLGLVLRRPRRRPRSDAR